MEQITTITLVDAENLVKAIRLNNRNADIDWVNRTIRVVGPWRVDPKVILSDGPLWYQDILYQFGE